MLKWNSTNWTCANDIDTNTPTIDATNLTAGTLDDARLSANISKLGSTIESNEISDATITGADIANTAISNAQLATGIDALKLGTGVVNNTELSYLDGVTSSVQSQLTTRVLKSGDELSGSLTVSISTGAGTQNALVLKNSQNLRFENDQASPNFISLRAPTGVFTNQNYVLPAAPGTDGQVLRTDASGNLSWTTPGNNLSSLSQLTVNCTAGQVIKSDGSGTWSCQADADSGGAGGSTPADGSVSTIKLVNGAVTAIKLNSMGCLNGEILKFNGSNWACAADANNNITTNASLLTSGTLAIERLPTSVSLFGTSIEASEIADGTITTDKIASNTVTSENIFDASLVDADIAANAGIATSKLAGPVTAMSGHGLGLLATMSTIASAQITNDTILDADISGAAAISDSKLATISTAGKVSGSAITTGVIGGTTAFTGSQGIMTSGTIAGAGNFVVSGTDTGTTELRFADNDNSNYIGLKAPADIAENKVWTLPAADGASGQVLVTDGLGNLSWSARSSNIGISDNATTTAMTIDASGNIGIGTTAPTQRLSVNGTIQATSGGFMFPDGTMQSTAALTRPMLVGRKTFTTSGTWTRPAGVTMVRVFALGGGGGGAGSTNGRGGGGGGAGAICFQDIDVSNISSATVNIGAAGAAGVVKAAGGNGGNTSFGSSVSANGGEGGLSNGTGDAGGSSGGNPACLIGQNGYSTTNNGGAEGASVSDMGVTYGTGGIDNKRVATGNGSGGYGGNYSSATSSNNPGDPGTAGLLYLLEFE